MNKNKIKSTTIIGIRKDNLVVIAGDGQASLGNTVMKSNVKKISSVISDIINQDQLVGGINNIKVINSWKKIAGKNILSYVTKINFINGNLYVKLKSAPLRNELNFNKERFLNQINEDLKNKIVKKIIFN